MHESKDYHKKEHNVYDRVKKRFFRADFADAHVGLQSLTTCFQAFTILNIRSLPCKSFLNCCSPGSSSTASCLKSAASCS